MTLGTTYKEQRVFLAALDIRKGKGMDSASREVLFALLFDFKIGNVESKKLTGFCGNLVGPQESTSVMMVLTPS